MTTRRPTSVAEEIHQTRPFQSTGHEAVITLFRTAAVIDRYFTPVLEEEGLTGPQYNVLRILRGAHPARLACSDIAERMIERDPDITRLIDRLEKRGLVKRSRSRQDRRVVEVGMTDKGLVLVRGLDAHVQRLPKALLGRLGAERVRQLATLLEAVISELGTFP